MSPPTGEELTDYVNNIGESNAIDEIGARGDVGEICTEYIDIASVINAQRRNTQTGNQTCQMQIWGGGGGKGAMDP